MVLPTFGVTTATIQVRAEAGSPTQSYTLNINRPLNNDARLTTLVASTDLNYNLALNPTFSSTTYSYAVTVASWTAGVTLAAALSDPVYGSMTVNGVSLGNGASTSVIPLNTDGINGATTVIVCVALSLFTSFTL